MHNSLDLEKEVLLAEIIKELNVNISFILLAENGILKQSDIAKLGPDIIKMNEELKTKISKL